MLISQNRSQQFLKAIMAKKTQLIKHCNTLHSLPQSVFIKPCGLESVVCFAFHPFPIHILMDINAYAFSPKVKKNFYYLSSLINFHHSPGTLSYLPPANQCKSEAELSPRLVGPGFAKELPLPEGNCVATNQQIDKACIISIFKIKQNIF